MTIKHEKMVQLITFEWEGNFHKILIKVKKGALRDAKKENIKKKYKGIKIKTAFHDTDNKEHFIVEGLHENKLIQVKV